MIMHFRPPQGLFSFEFLARPLFMRSFVRILLAVTATALFVTSFAQSPTPNPSSGTGQTSTTGPNNTSSNSTTSVPPTVPATCTGNETPMYVNYGGVSPCQTAVSNLITCHLFGPNSVNATLVTPPNYQPPPLGALSPFSTCCQYLPVMIQSCYGIDYLLQQWTYNVAPSSNLNGTIVEAYMDSCPSTCLNLCRISLLV